MRLLWIQPCILHKPINHWSNSSLARFTLTFKKPFHFLIWKLRNWNINNSTPNHNLLTAANESPPPTHTSASTSPVNLCLPADSRPLFGPCPLSWGVRSLCCYFCTARSVAGQDMGGRRTGGREKGTRGRSGGEVTCSDRLGRWGEQEAPGHYFLFFLENANALSTSLVHSFLSFTDSFISHTTEGTELVMASPSFHQRFYNQLSTD